ncbi:Beta-lactamase [Bacillus thuringiensis serovar thuringiensis str. T01001]|nr:Beta-lactamase [Bacillus thuringiensis Bt407]EEM34456.1 Beta-lactamase [Bacillus thuringiensis serovar thuringiensis str. T01001]EEM65534.1 Beta-lactamase [Bacillus thuringiensis serovar berliner ATCC 10792]
MIGEPINVRSTPSPNVEVNKSRTVIGRRAGTVSSSGPSGRFNTCRSASSGSHLSTGSSKCSLHSSSKTITGETAIGLLVDANRKIVSRRIGAPPSCLIVPSASTCVSPFRLTKATSPGIFPESTCRANILRILRNPVSEKPLLFCPILFSFSLD